MFKFLLYQCSQSLVRGLSLKNAYRLGVFLSLVQYWCSPRDRRAVKANLRAITGETSRKQLDRMTKEVFTNFGKYLVEFFRMIDEINAQFIKDRVILKNEEYLKEAFAKGKGVIFLTAHVGNWELGGVVLSQMGYSSTAIALPHKERPVNELFNRQRESHGITIVPLQQAARKCLSALKAKKAIALLADRDFTNNGEYLDFFGKKVIMPKGPAIFSYKTGAPILPIFIVRGPDDKFIFNFYKPIEPPFVTNEMIKGDELISLMKKCTAAIEDIVRQYPTQWLMFRRFWDKKANII